MTTSTKNFVYNIQNPIQGKKEPTITKKMLNDFRTEIAKYLPKDK